MAECVSCGRDIPAGKLFCDDCYKKMKGRKGTLKDVTKTPATQPLDGGAGEIAEGAEGAPGAGLGPQEPAEAPEVVKKASGELTPTSNKKVVSMKPDLDKATREKGKGGKKRFTVTITFSERTYTALARLGRKRESGAETATGEAGEVPGAPSAPRATRGKAGPHGRPMLKAVGGVPAAAGRQGFFRRTMAYRDRQWDFWDKTAAFMATAATILAIVLPFLDWIRLNWFDNTGAEQTLNIKGIAMGWPVYIIMILAFISWLYMALTWLLKRPLINIDYGVLLLVVGVLIVVIFYISLFSPGLISAAADRTLGRGGGYFQRTAEGSEQHNLWPAYAMAIMGFLIAISGLIRFGERKAPVAAG